MMTSSNPNLPTYWSKHKVVAYRWTRNDVKSSKMYMSLLAGIENLDINAKMRLTNARAVAF